MVPGAHSNALLPEPGHRLLGDERQGGDGDQAVDQEGGAGIFLPERLRQFALECPEQRCLVLQHEPAFPGDNVQVHQRLPGRPAGASP